VLSISMFDAMADWMTVPLLQQEAGSPPRRIGLAHTSISPYGAFQSRDGVDILISIHIGHAKIRSNWVNVFLRSRPEIPNYQA